MEMSRRKFLGASAAAVIVAGTKATGKVFGANDRIRFCCIGIHGQGGSHIKELMSLKDDAEIVALCDVDSKVLEARVKAVKDAQGKEPKAYKDLREVMADKNVDAITTATPNHWHSLVTVWGCQAGKDVYVEKPLSHGIWEGRQAVAAAEKNKRIVMHGTQSRSNATLIRDIKLMHDGFIGPISHSRGYVYKNGNRGAIGFGKPGKPPENLDWTLWQGPSPDHEFLLKDAPTPDVVRQDGEGLYVHYNWHWFWEYGNGEVGNQGVHEMDVASTAPAAATRGRTREKRRTLRPLRSHTRTARFSLSRCATSARSRKPATKRAATASSGAKDITSAPRVSSTTRTSPSKFPNRCRKARASGSISSRRYARARWKTSRRRCSRRTCRAPTSTLATSPTA
jgi:hypothetical protein